MYLSSDIIYNHTHISIAHLPTTPMNILSAYPVNISWHIKYFLLSPLKATTSSVLKFLPFNLPVKCPTLNFGKDFDSLP